MITKDEIMRAIKISQTLQDYFEKDNGPRVLRSTDAYDILVKKNVVEKDRFNGIKFREFLRHLDNNNELKLIPQCRGEKTGGNSTQWFFESAPNKTIKTKNLIPVASVGRVKTIDTDDIINKISTLPKRNTSQFTPKEIETRENYIRAYEYWSPEEEKMLIEVVNEITDPYKLSDIFQRQPSAIKSRLKDKFNIII